MIGREGEGKGGEGVEGMDGDLSNAWTWVADGRGGQWSRIFWIAKALGLTGIGYLGDGGEGKGRLHGLSKSAWM